MKSTRERLLEKLNSYKDVKNINESEIPDVGPELALSMFGKIYAGDPATGIVPGARPMSDEERIEITYKMARDILKKNGHDPNLADKWFLKWFGKSYSS